MAEGDTTENDCSRSSSSSNLMLKKLKGNEESLVDRMSELPESLLVQILSLLPTKDAFETHILSKRWSYLWTFVHDFNFTLQGNGQKDITFISFVDYVLAHSISLKINKFKLVCSFLDVYKSEVSRWLGFAVERKVEDIVFWSIINDGVYELPESFRTCSSLITLQVMWCHIDFDTVIAWKSLKTIMFVAMPLYDEYVLNVLSGCPALETMELINVWGFRVLEITSLKLKRLKLKSYEDDYVEIIAPYLQHLEILGVVDDFECRLVDVSSLVNAKLTFHIRCIKDTYRPSEVDDKEDSCRDYHQGFKTLVQDYLQKLNCASELTIGTWFIEVMCMLQFEGVQIPELKCKHLTLELDIKKFNLYGAASLLRASPHVEIVNIDIATQSDPYRCHFELRHLAKGGDINLDCCISSFEFPNLKNVKIIFSSRWLCLKDHSACGFDKLSKLSEFLLMNAKLLEKIIIISKSKCKSCSVNCVSQYALQLAKKLLGCPRSSTGPVIISFQE